MTDSTLTALDSSAYPETCDLRGVLAAMVADEGRGIVVNDNEGTRVVFPSDARVVVN